MGQGSGKKRPEGIPPGACVPRKNQQVVATPRGNAPAERSRTGTIDPQSCPGFEQRLGVGGNILPRYAPVVPQSFLAGTRWVPSTAFNSCGGGSLWGAGQGGGTQRCSDLPGPGTDLRTSPPSGYPGFPALWGGWSLKSQR